MLACLHQPILRLLFWFWGNNEQSGSVLLPAGALPHGLLQELGLPQASLQGCTPRENLWTVLLSGPERKPQKAALKVYGCQKWVTHFGLSWVHPEFLFFLVCGAVSSLWK